MTPSRVVGVEMMTNFFRRPNVCNRRRASASGDASRPLNSGNLSASSKITYRIVLLARDCGLPPYPI
uniref:Terminase n=1 Tax=uncultured marine virus TaxID=186617 RepID=A0A0F7L472_9VIRU|nr:terminase [uncultured marine virus]